MKMSWGNVLLILCLGVFLGGTAGVLAMRYFHPMMHRGHSDYYRNRLMNELRLNPDQQPAVEAALQRNREKLDKIFAEDRKEIEEVRRQTQEDIRKLLTPEQQRRFDQLQVKMKDHFDRVMAQREGHSHH